MSAFTIFMIFVGVIAVGLLSLWIYGDDDSN